MDFATVHQKRLQHGAVLRRQASPLSQEQRAARLVALAQRLGVILDDEETARPPGDGGRAEQVLAFLRAWTGAPIRAAEIGAKLNAPRSLVHHSLLKLRSAGLVISLRRKPGSDELAVCEGPSAIPWPIYWRAAPPAAEVSA